MSTSPSPEQEDGDGFDLSPTPSAVETESNTSNMSGTASGHRPGDDDNVVMGMDVVDRSHQDLAEREAEALRLKDLGNAQLLKGHYLEAIGHYTDALEYSPSNAIILSNRAQAYIKVENYGLAMADASAALESEPSYAKAYYRRGSAQFALGHLKDARKDFRQVCKLQPKSKDSRAKLQACEKAIREEAFRKAIESENTIPLSEQYDANAIVVAEQYDGPNPTPDGAVTNDMEFEASLFEPGNLPREFVMVRLNMFQRSSSKRNVALCIIPRAVRSFFLNSRSFNIISLTTYFTCRLRWKGSRTRN